MPKPKPLIRRSDVFELYVLFKSLPHFLKYPHRVAGVRPTPREFAISLGITEEITLSLLDLQTQKNFADRFSITEQTLGRWNKVIADRGILDDLKKWAQPLTKNLIFKLYTKTMEADALPGYFKLWFQVVAGWSEKDTPEASKRPRQTVTVVRTNF